MKFEATDEYAKYITDEVMNLLINKLGLSAHTSYGTVNDKFIRLNIDIEG